MKLLGEFVWHKHEKDELFYVLKGRLKMEFRGKTVIIEENELIIIRRGIEHRPVADNEVSVMLFEPVTTLNIGNTKGELTRETDTGDCSRGIFFNGKGQNQSSGLGH